MPKISQIKLPSGDTYTLHDPDVDNKADLASPSFTGTPTSPTPAASSDNQQIATTVSAGVTTTEATISVSNTTLVIG